jgi:hypothetical protein
VSSKLRRVAACVIFICSSKLMNLVVDQQQNMCRSLNTNSVAAAQAVCRPWPDVISLMIWAVIQQP